jgi:hypothetical protein
VDNILDFNNAKRQDEQRKGDISAESIRERLNYNPAGFVGWLFSGRALVSRGTARVGDVMGTPGASLSINLAGPDKGLWKDHATEEGGDLIGLYRANMGYVGTSDFVLSLKEIARDYLGDVVEIERPTWRPTPSEKIEAAKAKLGTKPRADMLELGAPVATYRYFDTHANIIASVVRFEPEGTRESKTFRPWCFRTIEGVRKWMPGAPELRPLYRLPEWATSPTVVLVEGEGKADALHSVGFAATSAMQGARAPIEKTDWSPLAGKAVIIWPDNDEPGLIYARAASAKLVSIGCRVSLVTPPADKPAKWDAGDCVAEGGDVAAVLLTAVEVASQPKAGLFEYLDIAQIKAMPNPKWLVSGMVVERALGFIYGPPGCLKTFIALDMALSITTGQEEWWGRSINRKGAVIYICNEGMASLKFRIAAWELHRKVSADTAPFYLIRQAINFMKPEDVGTLLATVEAVAAKVGPIAAVFVDTVSKVLPGAEENLQKDMTLFVGACGEVRDRFGAVVFGLHHTNKSGGIRGSTVIPGAGDFMIEVRREPGAMTGSIFASKIKDGEDGWEQFFKVEKIKLDDTLGGPSSLVVDPLDAQPKREGGAGWPSRDICKEILAAIHEQWMKGSPWCHAKNSSRAALPNIMKRWNLKREVVTDILSSWTARTIIEEDEYDTKKHAKGYRKLLDI